MFKKIINSILEKLGYIEKKNIKKIEDKLENEQKNLKCLLDYTNKLEKKVELANEIIDNNKSKIKGVIYQIDNITSDLIKYKQSILISKKELDNNKFSLQFFEINIKKRLLESFLNQIIDEDIFFNKVENRFKDEIIYEFQINFLNRKLK
jgi:seryl-tRNA synthetase